MEQGHDIQEAVRRKYGELASGVRSGEGACCGPSCCSTDDPVTGNLYPTEQTTGLPKGAVDASLGCGNPTTLIDLHEGDTVLDLGSGGGIDVLLSARRVGPAGKVYGLDMTDEMLDLARDNQRTAGVVNVDGIDVRAECLLWWTRLCAAQPAKPSWPMTPEARLSTFRPCRTGADSPCPGEPSSG